MVEVESYLRTDDGQFTPVASFDGTPHDARHVEGAMILKVNGVAILDLSMWDYIDQLWAYIGGMVSGLSDSSEASTYFPDQPIKLTFRRHANDRVLVSVELAGSSRNAWADERDFITELQAQGAAFFRRMSALLPENRQSYDIALANLMSCPA